MTSSGGRCVDILLRAALAIVLFACSAAAGASGTTGAGADEQSLEVRMQKRISVDFPKTPIQDVIRLMADQAQVDHIISPTVVGEVTVKLTDVPLAEAMDSILSAHGYGYSMGTNIIRVAPIAELQQVDERLVHKVFQITYADVSEVAKALEKIRSKQGMVSHNQGTSHIIVTDTESKMRAMEDFIEQVDKMTPQVLVEVRIYDITSKDRFDFGVEWDAGRETVYSPDTTGGKGTVGTNPSGDVQPFATGVFRGATGKTTGTTGLLRFGWLADHLDIDAVLRAQQNDLDAKLLANPRVLVLDNEKANIRIVQEIPYQELTESSEGGQIGTTAFRDVGVELEVTPHVTREQMVRLDLMPKFSLKTDEVVLVGSGDSAFPQPVIDRREAYTTLLVESGKTVVLGGMRSKTVNKVVNKIPLLGDVPVAGWLFKFEGEDTVMSELVVFITPRIVERGTLSPEEREQYESTNFPAPRVSRGRFEKEGDGNE